MSWKFNPFTGKLDYFEDQATVANIWDVLLFVKRTFNSDEDINVPSDKVLQMHSPSIDGELFIDGEVYIL